MNQVHLLGNLTYDPELRYTPSGVAVVNFTVAVNRRFKKGDDWGQEVAFVECVAWDTGAQTITDRFHKGDPIIVHGALVQESWDDKNTGQKRSKLKLRVNSFQSLPGKKGDGKPDSESPAGDDRSKSGPDTDDEDEELPF